MADRPTGDKGHTVRSVPALLRADRTTAPEPTAVPDPTSPPEPGAMISPRPTRSPLSLAGSPVPGSRERRLLLVEPDADVAAMLRLTLGARLPNARTVWCPDPRHASGLLRRTRFDAMICEPVATGAGGLALVRELNEDPTTAGVPVLVLSTDPSLPAAGLREHPNIRGWFTKPLELTAFFEALSALLTPRGR